VVLQELATHARRHDCRIGASTGNVSCWLACCAESSSIHLRYTIRGRESALKVRILGCPPVVHNQEGKNVANIKSQIKRIGTNKKAQDRNKAVKSELKTAVRATRTAIAAGDKDAAVASLALASKKLDKAASKGVIHKNQAANKKSAIAKKVASL